MIIETHQIHEHHIPRHRLGRHVRHDPRSWGFPAPMSGELRSVTHTRNVPVFDQGELGSCTGNAAAGCLSTAPYTQQFTEADAIGIYAEATHLDRIAGIYPPDDTGSSGLAVMKALKKRGVVKGYTHAFGLSHVLRALVLSPGITGIAWRSGCDTPDSHGIVKYRGAVRGGHEIVIDGLNVEKSLVWFTNSWGPGWGFNGRFAMSFDDYCKALADHGDATFPVL